MRAVVVCYQLSNLLLYKHELLLSKCPLTADWLLIRPVWNEISDETLNYDPIPEHIISHMHIPFVCLSTSSISAILFFFNFIAFCIFPCGWSFLVLAALLSWPLTSSLFFFLHHRPHSQSVTAVGDQTNVCLTWNSTGALAVGGDVWAAETTPMGPTVSAAEMATTGNLQKIPAYPATAMSTVNCRHKNLSCFDNNWSPNYDPCQCHYLLLLFSPAWENVIMFKLECHTGTKKHHMQALATNEWDS